MSFNIVFVFKIFCSYLMIVRVKVGSFEFCSLNIVLCHIIYCYRYYYYYYYWAQNPIVKRTQGPFDLFWGPLSGPNRLSPKQGLNSHLQPSYKAKPNANRPSTITNLLPALAQRGHPSFRDKILSPMDTHVMATCRPHRRLHVPSSHLCDCIVEPCQALLHAQSTSPTCTSLHS